MWDILLCGGASRRNKSFLVAGKTHEIAACGSSIYCIFICEPILLLAANGGKGDLCPVSTTEDEVPQIRSQRLGQDLSPDYWDEGQSHRPATERPLLFSLQSPKL